MTLDTHRYGALIVLDRSATLVGTFAPHLALSRDAEILSGARNRLESAEAILTSTNNLIDGSERYSSEVVEACILGFQSLQTTFQQELQSAEQSAKLGPMLPDDYKEARRIFLEDLAAR